MQELKRRDPNWRERTTELIVDLGPAKIYVDITGPRTFEARREIAKAILKQIEPLMPGIDPEELEWRSRIFHWGGEWPNRFRDWDRNVSLRTALDAQSAEHRLGFEIRMLRLKNEWTQQELADRLGLTRTHLSRIEHGKHRVRAALLAQLNAVFGDKLGVSEGGERLKQAKILEATAVPGRQSSS